MRPDPEYQFFWWLGSLGVALAWIVFTIALYFAAADLAIVWDWYQAPWVGRFGYPVLIVLTALYLRMGRAGWKASLALSLGIAGPILLLGLESAILALFGSPSWESVQAWARIQYPDQSWVQEPIMPRHSACSRYCWDVRIWGEIRAILAGGY